MSISGHTIITGGSSGIGYALAERLVRRGGRVSLIARDTARLQRARDDLLALGAAQNTVLVVAADVMDPRRLDQAVTECEDVAGEAGALIASAGIVCPKFFHEQPVEDFDRQILTNLLGVANSVRAVYALMRLRGRGRIMIVSSGAAFVGIPGYAAYCASKAALRAFASSLRLEAKPAGIQVSICFPPDTDTPQLQAELPLRPEAARLFMGGSKPWPADKVAERILAGMEAGKDEVNFGLLLTVLARTSPALEPLLQSLHLWRTAKTKTTDTNLTDGSQ